MSNPGPTKEEYDSLIYKLATLESELGQARRLLEAPAKPPWWKRYWGVGSKAAVVLLVASVLLVGVAGGKGSDVGVQEWRTLGEAAKIMYMAGFSGGLQNGGLLMVFDPKKLMEIDSCTAGWTYGQFVAVVDKYVKITRINGIGL